MVGSRRIARSRVGRNRVGRNRVGRNRVGRSWASPVDGEHGSTLEAWLDPRRSATTACPGVRRPGLDRAKGAALVARYRKQSL
jgi:hypothetical protein